MARSSFYGRRQDNNGREVFQLSSVQYELTAFDDNLMSRKLRVCKCSPSMTEGNKCMLEGGYMKGALLDGF